MYSPKMDRSEVLKWGFMEYLSRVTTPVWRRRQEDQHWSEAVYCCGAAAKRNSAT